MPGEELQQASLERARRRAAAARPPRRRERQHRREASEGRRRSARYASTASGSPLTAPPARARNVASSRPNAASTASVCSGCSPPCSAAAAASATGSRCFGQLVEPARDALGRPPALELGQRRLERQRELERGLAPAALVEVEPGAQREVLAGERDVAAGQDRGQPLLRAPAAPSASPSAAAARSPPPSRRPRPARPSRSRSGSPAPAPRSPRRRTGRSPTAGGRGSRG